MYEDGRRHAHHRIVTDAPVHCGRLSLKESPDHELRRAARSARLTDADGIDVLPALRDAVVLYIDGERMTITGFEQDEVTKRCTVQTWYIEAQ